MVDWSSCPFEDKDAALLKYLAFIQDVITRMNRNSFQMKGWCLTIVSALLALSANNNSWQFSLVAFLVVIPFYIIDSFYLLMERQFRGVYEDVIGNKETISAFTFPLDRYTPDNAKTAEEKKRYTYWRVLFSKTECPFYLSIEIVCLITALCVYGCRSGSTEPKGVVLEKTIIDHKVTTNAEYRITGLIGEKH